jgi:hypothetical protein
MLDKDCKTSMARTMRVTGGMLSRGGIFGKGIDACSDGKVRCQTHKSQILLDTSGSEARRDEARAKDVQLSPAELQPDKQSHNGPHHLCMLWLVHPHLQRITHVPSLGT